MSSEGGPGDLDRLVDGAFYWAELKAVRGWTVVRVRRVSSYPDLTRVQLEAIGQDEILDDGDVASWGSEIARDDGREARPGSVQTRRVDVPGGWLYQVASSSGWSPPAFVPRPIPDALEDFGAEEIDSAEIVPSPVDPGPIGPATPTDRRGDLS